MKILVTGGSGFIGSNFIDYILKSTNNNIINIDKMTYAAKSNNIKHLGIEGNHRYTFYKGDIAEKEFLENIFRNEKPDIICNFAAESHVDRSIKDSKDFIQSNIVGTVNLMDIARKHEIKRFIHISTDEVYGSIKEGSYDEGSKINPSSPYSASKAAAEQIIISYIQTHKFPAIITRSANNYGPYQFPEKLLPLFITNLIDNKQVPLMWSEENPGKNIRDWLYVKDNCRAIWHIAENGEEGAIYNISGENEKTNIGITHMLLKEFGVGEEVIQRIDHRKAHDFRYSITNYKLKNLGFQYEYLDLISGLQETIQWYKNNQDWWRPIKEEKEVVIFSSEMGEEVPRTFGYKVINHEIENTEDISKLGNILKNENENIVHNTIGRDQNSQIAGRTKGIILAGGKGTRLYPITQVTNKQLLPVYDKPMIYYPLSVLMLANIRDILIISTPEDVDRYRELLKDGSQIGINITYKVQEHPRGLADAFIVGEEFIGNDNVALILGDNLFYGNYLQPKLQEAIENKDGATIFAYKVADPSKYGVVEFDKDRNVISLEEKPEDPKSDYAVVGLYFYDNSVVEISKNIQPSPRGEIEITDINKEYLKRGKLKVQEMRRGFAWLDTGSFSALSEASEFIKIVQNRQGVKIGCIEEIAYRKGYISSEELGEIAKPLKSSGYGKYLLDIIRDD
jgi:glucose-1-phosphate thymidylyltransferase